MTNRLAITSFIASLFTIIFFCIGFLPIPLTAIPCYPAALIAALIALFSGGRAITTARARGESAGWMPWFGVITGLFTISAVACFTTITLMAFPYLINLFQNLAPAG